MNAGSKLGTRQLYGMSLSAWWMTGVFMLAGFISYTDRLILGSLVDRLKPDLALSDSQVAVLQGAAFALVYIIAGLVFGRMADRIRRQTFLLVAGALIWCLGTVACGLARNFEELFMARMLVGIGEATLAPVAVSMLAATVPPERLGTAVGAFVMGTIVGGPGAIAVSGGLLAYFDAHGAEFGLPPWRLVLITAGVAGLILPLLFLTLRKADRRSRPSAFPIGETFQAFRARAPAILPIYIGLALLSIGDFGLLTWSPSLLTRNFGLGPGEIALIFGIGITSAGIIGSFGGGVLLDRVAGRRGVKSRLYWIAIMASVAMLAAASLALPSPFLVSSGVLLWTVASAIVAIGGIAALQQSVPANCRGLAMSLVSFFAILIGLGAGPSLIAGVTDRIFGQPGAVGLAMTVVCAPAALAGAILFVFAGRKAGTA